MTLVLIIDLSARIKGKTPKDWFEPYGWKVSGTENGEDWKSILNAYSNFNGENLDRPKAIWVKTRKGRGYLKYDRLSHGSPHEKEIQEFCKQKRFC